MSNPYRESPINTLRDTLVNLSNKKIEEQNNLAKETSLFIGKYFEEIVLFLAKDCLIDKSVLINRDSIIAYVEELSFEGKKTWFPLHYEVGWFNKKVVLVFPGNFLCLIEKLAKANGLRVEMLRERGYVRLSW